jgi:hypothetical protein
MSSIAGQWLKLSGRMRAVHEPPIGLGHFTAPSQPFSENLTMLLGGGRKTIWPIGVGRLRRNGQGDGFRPLQRCGRFAEVQPGGGRDALDVFPIRRQIEIELQDVSIGQIPLQLQGTQALQELARERSILPLRA